MKNKKKAEAWLQRLTEASLPITNEQFKKVLEYTKWVIIRKTAEGFEETFSKYKTLNP